MNKVVLHNFLRCILLMLVQIFILDQVQFLGFISPLIYCLFILLLPIKTKLHTYLITAFLYGLVLDFFQDTGGAHAAACLTLAFCRNAILILVYGESYKLKNLKITTSEVNRQLLLLVLAIIIHHVVFYSLVIFNLSQILVVLKMTLFVGMASLFICFLTLLLIRPKKRS